MFSYLFRWHCGDACCIVYCIKYLSFGIQVNMIKVKLFQFEQRRVVPIVVTNSWKVVLQPNCSNSSAHLDELLKLFDFLVTIW